MSGNRINTPNRAVQAGLTLIELMVVVAIVGVLISIALITINKDHYASTAEGFAGQISATCEMAGSRAVALNRWQRLTFSNDEGGAVIQHQQALVAGSVTPGTDPTDWDNIAEIRPAGNIEIAATDGVAHDEPATSVPTSIGVDALYFAPDGTIRNDPTCTACGMSIFLHDEHDRTRARVAIFPLTGAALVFDAW